MSGFEFHQVEIVEIYQKERLKEAEMARLARQASSQKSRRNSRLAAALIWLGRQMVRWGTRLQHYYAPDIQMIGGPYKAHG